MLNGEDEESRTVISIFLWRLKEVNLTSLCFVDMQRRVTVEIFYDEHSNS